MASKEDLEKLDIIHLAVLCGKVGDNSEMDEQMATRAEKLKHEWALLVVRESPPPPTFKEHEEIQVQKAKLKQQMIDLLIMV